MHEELIERLTNAAARDWTLPHDKLCIHEAIAALSQPSGDSGQLAGWQLVPVEPTTGMVCNAVGELTSEQARRVYKAMLAAAPPPPVAAPSGWLPIESAPKNKRIALGWDYLKTQAPCFGQWDEDQYAKKPRPFWRTDVDRYRGLNEERRSPPSHWMDITPPAPREPSP